jgi:hypothetical protein
MISAEKLSMRKFLIFGSDGSSAGVIALDPHGVVTGSGPYAGGRWDIVEGTLRLIIGDDQATVVFETGDMRPDGAYLFRNALASSHSSVDHILIELRPDSGAGIVSQLKTQLFDGDTPLAYADPRYLDDGYPHTNIEADIIHAVLEVVRPRFWLEIGSMLGGSAIRTANCIRLRALTQKSCVSIHSPQT